MSECTREMMDHHHGVIEVDDDDAVGSTLDEDLASFIFDLLSFDASMTSSSNKTMEHGDDTPTPKSGNHLPVSSIEVQQEQHDDPPNSASRRRYPFIKSKYDIFKQPSTQMSSPISRMTTDPKTPAPHRYPSSDDSTSDNDDGQRKSIDDIASISQQHKKMNHANNVIDKSDDLEDSSKIPDLTHAMSQESAATAAALSLENGRYHYHSVDYWILVCLLGMLGFWILTTGSSLVVWLSSSKTTIQHAPTAPIAATVHDGTALIPTMTNNNMPKAVAPTVVDHNDDGVTTTSPKTAPAPSDMNAPVALVDTVDHPVEEESYFVKDSSTATFSWYSTTKGIIESEAKHTLPPLSLHGAPNTSFLSKLNLSVAGISPLAVYA